MTGTHRPDPEHLTSHISFHRTNEEIPSWKEPGLADPVL